MLFQSSLLLETDSEIPNYNQDKEDKNVQQRR